MTQTMLAQTMPVGLQRSLSFCVVGSRHVFMDLERDRYFCLESAAEVRFRALLDGLDRGDVPALGTLDIDNLIVSGETGQPLAPCPRAIASRSLLDEAPVPRWRRHVPGLWWALMATRRDLRNRSLASCLAGLGDQRAAAGPRRHGDEAALRAIAFAFERIALWVTRHDQCLVRSLALARYLVRHGLDPDLVFAVKLQPFQAHCWVECGGWLANDRGETVMHFTPIRRA